MSELDIDRKSTCRTNFCLKPQGFQSRDRPDGGPPDPGKIRPAELPLIRRFQKNLHPDGMAAHGTRIRLPRSPLHQGRTDLGIDAS